MVLYISPYLSWVYYPYITVYHGIPTIKGVIVNWKRAVRRYDRIVRKNGKKRIYKNNRRIY